MAIRTLTMLVVLGLVLLLSVALADKISCDNIEGGDCVLSQECDCSGGLYVCKSNKCVSFIDILRNRQPCLGVFKKRCSRDSDCWCNSAKLFCEDHECVNEKDALV